MKTRCTEGEKISVDIVTEDGMCNGKPELCFTLQSGQAFTIDVHEFNKIVCLFNQALKEHENGQ